MAHHGDRADEVWPSAAEDRIWRTIDEALAYHQKPGRDLTPTDALNRLFSRHVRHQRLRGMPRLSRETCSATCEAWTADELRSLVRWHCRAQPRFEHYPIVVARCGNRAFVLDGSIVEASTTTYSTPRWMRRQLKKRDHCCQFPGCRNTRFLHSHHIKRWTPDAPDTSLSNLVLLCPLHHGWVHHRGWQPQLEPATGIVSWLRPDGKPHDPAPPLREDFRERLFGPLISPIRKPEPALRS